MEVVGGSAGNPLSRDLAYNLSIMCAVSWEIPANDLDVRSGGYLRGCRHLCDGRRYVCNRRDF